MLISPIISFASHHAVLPYLMRWMLASEQETSEGQFSLATALVYGHCSSAENFAWCSWGPLIVFDLCSSLFTILLSLFSHQICSNPDIGFFVLAKATDRAEQVLEGAVSTLLQFLASPPRQLKSPGGRSWNYKWTGIVALERGFSRKTGQPRTYRRDFSDS